MKRRAFINSSMILASGLLLPLAAKTQVVNLGDAINKSGRQRMLSQRLAKAYCQIGLNIETDNSKKILDQSLSLFDRQLVELRAFVSTAELRSGLAAMEKNWLDYKQLLVGKAPNKHDAKTVISLSEDILLMADNSTSQLEKQAGNSASKLVNLAGRQRMLLQRMAKYYQAIQWEVAPSDAISILENTRKEFSVAMNNLNAAGSNTAKIKDELMLAQTQWVFFDAAIKQANDAKTHRQSAINVATTSERLLEVMDRVTGLYQQIA
ncbi:type IV pili methyl-accepting chemotaxis transducer N-terminal domain-containing protein [Undibacterium sp. SXout7W]|uniref:type IV pili methyl-accepting chemotaxis transducer N-terminal domain-containing protein n=1 Tax=Undibacterium sp. SXout7W TaxID=3413049 RepID=UPI003BF1D954